MQRYKQVNTWLCIYTNLKGETYYVVSWKILWDKLYKRKEIINGTFFTYELQQKFEIAIMAGRMVEVELMKYNKK